jgi:acyl-CoA synthetase (NDP forming)
VVWKGGRTDAGSAAARSHTGSLAISGAVWESLVRQIGAIHVYALDELVDVLLVLQQIGPFTGRRVGIMAGLTGGGGGISVSATDACAAVGLEVLPFSEATRSGLKDVLPPAGCILRNPLDVGAIGADPAKVGRIVELVLADPNLDALIVHEPVQAVAMTSGPEQLRAVNQLFARYRTEQPKPIIVVSPGRLAAETAAIEDLLASCGIPVFPTLERAALALSRLIGHYANR